MLHITGDIKDGLLYVHEKDCYHRGCIHLDEYLKKGHQTQNALIDDGRKLLNMEPVLSFTCATQTSETLLDTVTCEIPHNRSLEND